MSKQSDLDRQYWIAKEKQIVRDEYNLYLEEQGKESTPDAAALFAEIKIRGGYEYHGMKERELILFLAGSLPYMYD